ncbi:DNA helicase-2 / ATP-dependent DNA helicase PcrA [Hymenobacter gelipurpurascens]|uniref:DNA 3'-5' helicase n=1 Tax=Hymenobacter gelipurpurascens TaxID=89968 RepID=A0A212TFT8_9BACT|nr:UvrD-helicase domain-containing protein [Hymenobacter gelipurpurascens]SNC64879.1 DNA helicase-2 / ATP-dependent DNA helicase PcrA [Hymenobacter gelipurpurascens]
MGLDYLSLLNPSQAAAVMQIDGPCMIIAGAGSGKTRVLTYRIANLLEKNVDPFNILALTFTNKAAKEMRARIEKVVGPEAKNLWMGTFHSIFARILRSEADKIGYPRSFTIYDTQDSKTLIGQIVKELELDDKLYKPNLVLGRISAAKNKLISVQQYLNDPVIKQDDEAALRPKIGVLYQQYASRCFKAGAMDFDDLLYQTNVLFKDHPDVLNKYQNIFKYVMVDEYQDTNYSQYLIARKLAAKERNICVVGDDAQSIYAFRGADIQNILNFEKDYPELQVFKLEQNYRSTKNIVWAANSVIKNNQAQLRKDVFSDNEDGPLIEVLKAASDNEEGKLVAQSIYEDKMNHHLSYDDFAILYRTNAQSRAMEESLRKLNIKYKIVGGLSFYQRKEIKDLVAYLRLTVNPNDEQALRRVINYPKRGIGDTTLAKLINSAEESNHTIWEVVSNADKFLPTRTANPIVDFAEKIKAYTAVAAKEDAFEAAKFIAKNSGMIEELYADKSIEGLSRYENIQELLNGVKAYTEDPEREDKSLGAFLQDIALVTDADTKDAQSEGEQVTLMTIHSAKGLEFRNVYIVGMEENLFPSQMMITSRADLEEERRLFYVAITRAEKKLTLSYATSRYQWGNLRSCEKSRFLDEIDPQYVDFKFSSGPAGSPMDSAFGHVLERRSNLIPAAPRKTVATKYVAPSDFQPSDTSNLQNGQRVEHPKFGFGQVTKLENQNGSVKAIIQFEEVGEKTLLLSFAKLRIV